MYFGGYRLAIGLGLSLLSGLAHAQGWLGHAGNPQHTAVSPAKAKKLQRIRWQTPLDLNVQYSGEYLLLHYGSPLLTPENTVILPVKTGAFDNYRVEARRGTDGSLIWQQDTDYTLPPHGWTPSCGPTLTPDGRLAYPGAGGTIWIRTQPNSDTGTTTRVAFYGLSEYLANTEAYNTNLKICTPLTSDSQGNLYFGYVVLGDTPLHLKSGIARIAPNGAATYISAPDAANDPNIQRVPYNCAPALSNDGSLLYTAVQQPINSRFGAGYLVALNSQTLAPVYRISLKDPKDPNNSAILPDDGTSCPMIAPDGDVYYGVLENPFFSNHLRGWLLHFDGTLTETKTPGAFGWDSTPSLVPASAVPSYTGNSSYLLCCKYNNYAEGGGDGVNKAGVLDPQNGMIDLISGVSTMQEVLTVPGLTPDPKNRNESRPNAVKEWCINSAVVDPQGKCAFVNNEDGVLYRWDFRTNTLVQPIRLTLGIGEAYTPTLMGPDGTVYAVNNAILFAVSHIPVSLSGTVTLPYCLHPEAQSLTMEIRSAGEETILTSLTGEEPFTLNDLPAGTYQLAVKGDRWLRKVVTVNAENSVSGISISLIPGDANDDNHVDIFDLATLAEAFNSAPEDATWNPQCDFNCDDSVDVFDLAVLAESFNTDGDDF